MRRCPACGYPVTGTERFCPACGHGLSSIESNMTPAIDTTTPLMPAQNSRLAIASLICGVMTWILFFVPLFLAIPAVICGHLGHRAVQRGNGIITGKGIALIGMALGYAHLVLTGLALCVLLIVLVVTV
ncbi:MAG: DUF4190 domain-containing protein [Chloroflexus sp.]|uniref:DUF4190 domain-containing protein n=1 Tax=Chloroflexus sp. TaxID=1904827 RepID=UPI0030B75E10